MEEIAAHVHPGEGDGSYAPTGEKYITFSVAYEGGQEEDLIHCWTEWIANYYGFVRGARRSIREHAAAPSLYWRVKPNLTRKGDSNLYRMRARLLLSASLICEHPEAGKMWWLSKDEDGKIGEHKVFTCMGCDILGSSKPVEVPA